MLKAPTYRPTISADTNRGPSESIWGDCPVGTFLESPRHGMHFWEDFDVIGNASMSGAALAGSLGRWSVYGYQGATVSDGALEGGVVVLASDGDNEGIALLSSAGNFRITTTSTLVGNGKLWFECRVAGSTVTATKNDMFVGLMTPSLSSSLPAAAVPISTTDDTLSTTPSLIGFHRKGTASPTEWSFVFQLASGTAVYPTNLQTLCATVSGAAMTASGFFKLGFVFDPFAYNKTITSASTGQTAGDSARALLRVYVNGQPAPAFLTSTNVYGATFPTGFMSPVLSILNQTGTTPGSMSVDWIRVAQVANS